MSIGLTSLLVGGTLAVVAFTSTAAATDDHKDFDGNATTCEDASLGGEVLEAHQYPLNNENTDHAGIEYTISEDGIYLNLEVTDPNLSITGTVVKGSNAYRVYYGDPVPDMHAPPLDNAAAASEETEEHLPQISHWYVCGYDLTPTDTPTVPPTETPTPTESPSPTDSPTETPTETPSETPTPSDSPTPTETPTVSPSESPSPTDSPSESPSETPSESPSPSPTEPDLPDTGPGVSTGFLAGAGALLVLGLGLVGYSRRVAREAS